MSRRVDRIPLRVLLDGFTSRPDRTDRVLPITRLVGAIIAPVLLVAFAVLYGFPAHTEQLFAWTIAPELTPIFMGAGYGTGVYFFYRVVTVNEWHRVAAVFPGIAVFTWFMAGATFLHWENFNHDHLAFYAWTVLYIVSPVLVPGIWLLNRRLDPGHRGSTGFEIPRILRLGVAVSGILLTVSTVVLFVWPTPMIEQWAWNVSPLTSRILLGWIALFGVVLLTIAIDGRWTAARIFVHTQLIFLALLLVGFVRAWSDLDTTDPFTVPIVIGMAGFVIFISVLYVVMERRAKDTM